MIKIFFVLFISFSMELYASVEFHSPFVKKVEFSLVNASVFTTKQEEPISTIKNQLKYLFGSLNEVDSGVDFESLKINLNSVRATGENYEIKYSVSGKIAWDIKRALPEKLLLYLPRFGDIAKLQPFVNKYQKDCGKKSANIDSFWNYYRPHRHTCTIAKINSDDIIKIDAQLKETSTIVQRKFNYNEISRDGITELTAIFTKDKPSDLNDISITDYKKICLEYSKISTSFEQTTSECHASFPLNNQLFKVNIFLINNLNENPKAFLESIERYTLTSDIVTFNGHSGMGTNIRSFISFYSVPMYKYQIIFLNSCDTFSYFGGVLFKKFQVANNSASSNSWLDVILTATPNYFGTFSKTNMNLLDSIANKRTVSDTLLQTPPEQHSLIYFEN